MDSKDLYSEAGDIWRTLVGWREKVIVGYLTVIGAIAVAFVKDPTPPHRVVLLIGGIGVSGVLWILDFRNRSMIWACQRVGESLESTTPDRQAFEQSQRGCYSAFNAIRGKTRLSHGLALNLLVTGFVGGSVGTIWRKIQRILGRAPSLCFPILLAVFVFGFGVVFLEWIGDTQREKEKAS
jgi:hypothetical protein